jgi:DNA-binding HxlR family transcriptional regulator
MAIDFNSLDTAVHGPIRLGVMSALQIDGPLDFTTLKTRLDVADGALGLHLRKLEDIGYIACRKAFVGRRPRSTYRITPDGCRALANYLNAMQRVIDAVANKAQKSK